MRNRKLNKNRENYVRDNIYTINNISINMIKKIVFILTMSLVFMGSIFATTQLGPSLQIVPSNISSGIVKPGNDLTVKFNVNNVGNLPSKDVEISLKNNDIFLFKGSDKIDQNFYICPGCSFDATYYFTVKSGVNSGVYPLTFNIKHDTNQVEIQTINVNIQGVPDLIISSDNLDGKKLYASNEFDLDFDILNVGTGIAKNIKIISNSASILNVGSSLDYFNNVGVDSSKKITNRFKVDENLNPGLYNLPFTITFEDEVGKKYSVNYNLGVEILNKANIDIQYLKLSNYQVNLFSDIQVNGMVENIGYGKAKNVVVTAKTDLSGYTKSFVGKLDKNEDSPIQFKFKADSVGKHKIDLLISYNDDFGTHEVSESVEVNVVKPTDRLYSILGIVALLFVYISFRFVRGKKDKK